MLLYVVSRTSEAAALASRPAGDAELPGRRIPSSARAAEEGTIRPGDGEAALEPFVSINIAEGTSEIKESSTKSTHSRHETKKALVAPWSAREEW
jgi:hypothetical protein